MAKKKNRAFSLFKFIPMLPESWRLKIVMILPWILIFSYIMAAIMSLAKISFWTIIIFLPIVAESFSGLVISLVLFGWMLIALVGWPPKNLIYHNNFVWIPPIALFALFAVFLVYLAFKRSKYFWYIMIIMATIHLLISTRVAYYLISPLISIYILIQIKKYYK